MKVRLLSYTKNAQQVCAAAIRQCYSPIGAKELTKRQSQEEIKKLIEMVLGSGHTSTLEHASFTFAVEGVSRVTEIQLIRHRLASFSIQSGRYLKRGGAQYVIPKEVAANKVVLKKWKKLLVEVNKLYLEVTEAGIKAEDARYLQPQSLQTKIVFTMNARELLHFFEKRLCLRAQWEIRTMAGEMFKLVRSKAPLIFAHAGPTCVSQKMCWEGKMSCGQYLKIPGAVLQSRIIENEKG
jgi:thymidylate synthase (FAD)